MIRTLLSLLFPKQCLSCKKEGSLLCESCLSSPQRCGEISPGRAALFYYKDKSVAEALKLLKYKNIADVATTFSKEMDVYIQENFPGKSALIPIPSSRNFFSSKRDHTTVLSKEIQKRNPNNYEVAHILQNKRNRKRQVETQNKQERISNMKNAFTITRDIDPVSNYIVIDDVTTTGATLNEAVSTLQEAGAESVTGIAIAYQELQKK